MTDNLKIQIVGTLNTALTVEELNKKIKSIESKLSSVKLKIDIDDKLASTLNNFVKATEQLKNANTSLRNSFKEEETVIKGLDGSIEKINRKYLQTGEIIQKTTKTIDQRKNAIDKETETIIKQTQALEQYGKVQKEVTKTDSYGNQLNKNITTNNNGKNTTYNYDSNNNLKGTTNTVNYAQQEKQIEALRNSLTSLYNQGKVSENFFKNFNKVINSASNVKEIEKVKSALDRVSQVANNKAMQQKLTSDANTLLKTHSKTVDQVQLTKLIDNLKSVKPHATNASNTLTQMSDQLRILGNEAKEATRSSMGLVNSFETALVKYPVKVRRE